MAQPTNVPRWNTTGANRTDPPAGTKDSGLVAGAPLVSSYLNWLLFTIYEWTLYLKNLTTEALTWTAAHVFQKGISVSNSNVNGVGVAATGNGTGAGVRGTGGSNAAGVVGVAGSFGVGVSGTGSTGGSGGTFTGGATNGSGVEGYAGGGNAYGFYGNGSGNLHGIRATGGATGAGGRFTGGATQGAGVIGEGTGASPGVSGAGVGSGMGGEFTGGIDAAGVRGTGGSGGAGGSGGLFAGGSPTIGTGWPGVVAVGGVNAAGAELTGGGVLGVGVKATGGAAGGAGVVAINALSNVGVAIDSRGTIDFTYAGAPTIATVLGPKLTRNSFVKAWVLIQLNGTTIPTVLDGLNIGAVTQSIAGGTDGEITVTMASPMGSMNYAVNALAQNIVGGTFPLCVPKSITSNSVFILQGQTFAGAILSAVNWNTRKVYIEIMGS